MANFGYKGFSLSDSPSLNETPFHAPRPPLPEYRRPLEPEAAESFTRGLVNRGTSGLSYVMSSLDKPGRAVRGVLAGKPREALAAIPFSDTLGITDPDKAVSGRKLLTQHGILESGDKSWGATAAGIAAEYATDPLNLITLGTGGAVTKLGRATKNAGEFKNLSRVERLKGFDGIEPTLRAAGHDTERLANQGQRLASQEVVDAAGKVGAKAAANQPLAGLVGIGLPFRDPSLVLGTGKLAQSVAGFADRTGSAIAKTAPVRYARAAFDPSVRDAVGPAGQSAMSRYGVPAGHAAAIKARASHASLIDKVDAGLAAGIPERDLLSAARETGEGVPLAHHTPEAYAAAHPIGSQVRSIQDEHRALAEKLGYHSELNDPFAEHVPRGAVSVGEHARGLRPDTNFPTAGINQRHRKNELREIPGGTEAFNRWAADHAGGDIGTVHAAIDADVNDTVQRIGVATLPPEVLAGLPGKVDELASKIAGLDPKYRSAQHGPFAGGLTEPGYGTYFDPNLVGDMEQYAGTNKNLIESTSAVHGAVHQNVRPIQPGDVNLYDFYRSLDLKTTKPDPITGTPMKGALVEGLKKAAIAGAPDINPMLLGKRQDLINLARQYGIPAEVAAEFSKQYPKWAAPNTVAGPVKAVDTLTNLFKNLTYSIWPTSHVRNASSALTNNLMYGSGLDNHALAMRVMRDTATAAEIQAAHPGMPAGLADDAARKWIKAQAYANANTFGVHNQATDLAGGPARFAAGNRITPKLPGEGRTGPTGSLLGDIAHLGKEAVVGKPGETSPFDVLGQAGVGGKTVDTWSPLAAGRTAGTNIEDYFRLSNYLGNVKQGMAPAEAGSAVNKLHFDYTNATQFEKNVMRRLVPFYCVPADHEILTREGWKTYDQLDIGEMVMAYNHESTELSWTPLEDVATFDFDGELVKIERSNGRTTPTKFLCTENHRWAVETSKSITKGKHYGGNRKIVETKDFNSSHLIPLTGRYLGRGANSLICPRLAAILGWVVTDGYFRRRFNNVEMVIYQSPNKHLSEIVALTGNLPRKPHPDTGVCAVPVSQKDIVDICEFFGDKEDLPEIVCSLDRPSADAMWDAMFRAEGWTTGTGQQGFAQQAEYRDNRHVLDAFQILCLMTGRSANLNVRGCYIKKEKFIRANRFLGKESYKGVVWCPKTKYGTWVMRHDGCPIITGNTFQRNNLPLQLDRLIHRPSAISAQLRPFARTEPGQYTPDHIASGVAIPTGPEKDGNQQFVSQLGLPVEEAFERLKFKDNLPDIKGTALSYMGGMNPLIKGPLEQLFDTQFHTGRKLSDLHAPAAASAIGKLAGDDNPQILSQILANTPFTRMITTADKVMDERKPLWAKALNLGTGVRVTDVDMNKARAVESRKALEEMLMGSPNVNSYTNFYVRPENQGGLTPEETSQMQMLALLQQNAREYAEKKRQGLAP